MKLEKWSDFLWNIIFLHKASLNAVNSSFVFGFILSTNMSSSDKPENRNENSERKGLSDNYIFIF